MNCTQERVCGEADGGMIGPNMRRAADVDLPLLICYLASKKLKAECANATESARYEEALAAGRTRAQM